jgi:hypothetical protein
MANVVKKHSISSELAQKMVDQAVAKARELGVSENVAILDDGGNLKAFSRMDGAPILSIEIAQSRDPCSTRGVGLPWRRTRRVARRHRRFRTSRSRSPRQGNDRFFPLEGDKRFGEAVLCRDRKAELR